MATSVSSAQPIVDVQIASTDEDIPSEECFRRWVTAALPEQKRDIEVTVRVVSQQESQSLNRQYRHKDSPTNVLSFPGESPIELGTPFLGDLVICAAIVVQEARALEISTEAHWAHMVVHGVLHLLGYDHIEDAEAEQMETLENEIMVGLDYAAPYEI